MQYVPRPYQRMITDYILEHPRCSTWAFMGAGKGVATLTALDYMYATGLETAPTLVLGPLRVARDVWPYEVKKWDHLSGLEVVPIIGTETERRAALKRDAPVYTINYENLQWLIQLLGSAWPFGSVIADESTKLKGHRLNSGGARANALSKVAHSNLTKRWVNLTGTPSPNGLIDLWGQQWFVDQGGRLGLTFTAFKNRWFYQGFDGYSLKAHAFAQDQIQERLADCCLTIKAEDWFDLKEPVVRDIWVDLPPVAVKHYREMQREMFTQVESAGIEAFNSASMTIKCLQIANGAIFTDKDKFAVVHEAKLEALDDILDEWNGSPVIVAYHFTHDLRRLKARYPKGRILKTKRDEDDWNAGKIPLLFLHPESAGHGLNLQDGGNVLVFFGHWWSLEPYQQIIERIGPVRQLQSGHQRNVFIYHIYANGTVDEDVKLRRETKASVQDLLLNAMRRTK